MKQKRRGLDLSSRGTRKQILLGVIVQVVSVRELLEMITPHALVAKTGRPPFDFVMMLRIHCLQQWFGLSDLGAEEVFLRPAFTATSLVSAAPSASLTASAS